MKVCKKCNEEKPLDSYNKSSGSKDGKQSWCKTCVYEKSKDYSKYKTSRKRAIKKYNSKGKGVYGLFSNEVCLYVGESSKLTQRKISHLSCIKNPDNSKYHKNLYLALQKHTNIEFRILEETPNHKEKEKHYIDKLAPKYNNMYI